MTKEVRLGFVFLGSILGIYLLIAWGTQSGFFRPNGNSYKVRFQNVNGLKLSDPVLIRGFDVGKVKKMQLFPNYCEVDIELNQGIFITRNTTAEIQIRELLSGKQLVLNVEEGEKLPENSVIQGIETFDFSSALSKFGKLFHSPNAENATNKILAWIENIDSLFQLQEIQKIPFQVSRILGRVETLTSAFQQSNFILKTDTLFHSVQKLAEKIENSLNKLDILTEKIFEMTPRGDTLIAKIESNLENLNILLKEGNLLVKKIQNPNTVIGASVSDEQLLKELQLTLKNLNETLDHIRNKKIHVVAKFFGK